MLSYKFSGKHLIGASAKIGYGESKTSVAYQNKIYGEGFGSEPHINYINLGYGHYKQSHNVKGARSLNNEDDLTTIGLVYNGIFNSFNITAKANSIRKEQFFNRTHSDGTDWAGIGRFYLDGTEAGVRIEKLLQKGQLIFQTEYSSWSGSDMNTELKGSNYIYENSLFNAMIGYAKTKAGNADKEIYLTMGLESTDRKDGTASVKSSYQIANAGVLLFKRWGLGKVSALNIQLNPSYAKNLSSSLSYNTAQVSNYLKDVIIPDQLFYETDHLNVKADVRYIYRSPQRINWSFGLGIDHTQYMNTPEAMNALGNKQFQIRTSLGFSF
ncbi:hypothetical protein D3C80_1195350 [compost metagenome]